MNARLRLSVRLSRRLLRNSALRRSSAALGFIVAALVTLFLMQSALTLSGPQVASRDLGRFDYRLELPPAEQTADTPRLLQNAAAAAAAAGARHVATEITSLDVAPAVADAPFTIYLETSWTPAPYPDRFRLLSGRWPAAPGEVAVSDVLRSAVSNDDVIQVLSGLGRFRVVGVIADRYAESAGRILAAPGTVAVLDLPRVISRFTALDLQAAVSWRAGDEQLIARAVSNVVAARSGLRLSSRSEIAATPRKTFADNYPLGYRIPGLALPFLGMLTIFGMGLHSLRRALAALRASGVSRALTTGAVVGAASALGLAAFVAGALFGIGLGLGARPLVAWLAGFPLSPATGLDEAIVRLLLATASGAVVGTGWVAQSQRPVLAARGRLSAQGAGRLRTARLALVVGAGIVASGSAILPLDGVGAAMTVVGGLAAVVLLLTPEIVRAGLRLVPTSKPRGRLVRRQLEGAPGRTVTAVLLLTVALGGPLAFATTLATMIKTDEADQVPTTAPGRLVVRSDGGEAPAPPDVLRVVSGVLEPTAARRPVTLLKLVSERSFVDIPEASGGIAVAVERPADLERLDGGPLSPRQRRTLLAGGVLHWSATAPDSLAVAVIEDDGGQTPTVRLPAARIRLDPAWEGTYSGVMLRSTAQRFGLPVASGDVIFPRVSDRAAKSAKQAVIDGGLDPYYVKTYEGPPKVRAPLVFYLALGALSGLVALVVAALVRAQASGLRRLLGALTALGMSPRWARDVLLLQVAFTTIIATLLGLVIAGPIVALAVARLPGFELALPWGWLGYITGANFAATAISALMGSRYLRPLDRNHV